MSPQEVVKNGKMAKVFELSQQGLLYFVGAPNLRRKGLKRKPRGAQEVVEEVELLDIVLDNILPEDDAAVDGVSPEKKSGEGMLEIGSSNYTHARYYGFCAYRDTGRQAIKGSIGLTSA